MLFRVSILTFAVLSLAYLSPAQHPNTPPRKVADTTRAPDPTVTNISVKMPDETEKSKRLYDSIQAKTSRRKFWNAFYDAAFVPLRNVDESKVVDETGRYAPYKGKVIGEILTSRQNVFARNRSYFQKAANGIHVITLERTIKRDLLFDVGDKLDPEIMVRTKQILQSRDYWYEVDLRVIPRPDDPTTVDILVHTRDSWTIGVDAGYADVRGVFGTIYDVNFMGLGDELRIRQNYSYKSKMYQGLTVGYYMPNFLGTFYSANFVVGKSFDNRYLEGMMEKDFIYPDDYAGGVSFQLDTQKETELYRDDTTMLRYRRIDAWGGKAFWIKNMRSSIYTTGHYSKQDFFDRPNITGFDFNPAYHGLQQMLWAAGLYRENFYKANLIYGFGYDEYLAAGYKAELVGGYTWGEFHNAYYIGANYSRGGFSKLGYLMGEISVGANYDHQRRRWLQGAVDVEARWFSPLFSAGRSMIRQFVSFNYTRGWNRLGGSDEVISFEKNRSPRSLEGENYIGRNRAVINTEMVIFTPHQPLGFRLAVFWFADGGVLGGREKLFDNEFFGSVGFGIRLRNEHLIFQTFQLRFALAFRQTNVIHNQYVRFSSEERLVEYRFIPTAPVTVNYK